MDWMRAKHNHSHAHCNYAAQINNSHRLRQKPRIRIEHIFKKIRHSSQTSPKQTHLLLGAARAHDRHEFGACGRALAGVTDRGAAVNIRTYGMELGKSDTFKVRRVS